MEVGLSSFLMLMHVLVSGKQLSILLFTFHRSHLNSWRHLGHSIRSNGKQHWGIRWMPKTELVKELKLTTSRQPHRDDELSLEKLVDEWDETDSDWRQCHTNADNSLRTGPKCKRKKQLLQFDKSHRPAFYGNWPKKRSPSVP